MTASGMLWLERSWVDLVVSRGMLRQTTSKLLRGTKTPSVPFAPGVKSEVNSALSAAITRVLTPKTSTNILLDIKRKSTQSSVTALKSSDEPVKKDPYTMTFVGVNGVGKSTNLSKVCFWLLQNQLRVLIAACDTFRSGAVEQLRVHVRNLGMLGDQVGGEAGILGSNKVELYERGYGKDAAGIAKDAIAYGESACLRRADT